MWQQGLYNKLKRELGAPQKPNAASANTDSEYSSSGEEEEPSNAISDGELYQAGPQLME